MGGVTPTYARSPIFENIYIETVLVVSCTKFEVSCYYSFSKIAILLLAYNSM